MLTLRPAALLAARPADSTRPRVQVIENVVRPGAQQVKIHRRTAAGLAPMT